MGFFRKYFSDGEEEYGPDDLETTSWSRGRLSNITEVHISDEQSDARIVIPNTEWHFFDRYELILDTGATDQKLRVLQARIDKRHVGSFLQYGGNEKYLIIQYLGDVSETIRYPSRVITSDFIGKYATVVLEKKKAPRFLICDRGKYAD